MMVNERRSGPPAIRPTMSSAPLDGLIELRLSALDQLFDPFDPFPIPTRDLAKSAEEFVVGWAREHSRGAHFLDAGDDPGGEGIHEGRGRTGGEGLEEHRDAPREGALIGVDRCFARVAEGAGGGEDARARLYSVSEMAVEWRDAVSAWSGMLAPQRDRQSRILGGERRPVLGDEAAPGAKREAAAGDGLVRVRRDGLGVLEDEPLHLVVAQPGVGDEDDDWHQERGSEVTHVNIA